jgi:hypothetical protein
MRQSLILLVVLGALLLMPKEHTHQAGYAAGTPPSPTSTPVAPVPTVPPVVFIGDSVTMGAFVSTPENMFVVRVQRDLRARGLEATNDTEWTLDPYSDLLAARKAAASHRKLIIVELGVHWAAFDAAQFREVYGAMMDCLAGSGATVVVGTIPWLNWRPDSPVYFEMAYYSQIIRQEAAKRGIAVADLWAATDRRADAISRPDQPCFTEPTCRGDNYHPGDVGHALIAEAYTRALDAALANPPRPNDGRCNFDKYLNALGNGLPVPVYGP